MLIQDIMVVVVLFIWSFEREFSIMTAVNCRVKRLRDFLFHMSDCFGLVYVGEGRVWVQQKK